VASVPAMANDPRTQPETSFTTMADLDLLLAESDREDPYLTPARPERADEAEAAIDDQILAGLVTP
jgi:hypothetical protein